jgi:hypothetical protein
VSYRGNDAEGRLYMTEVCGSGLRCGRLSLGLVQNKICIGKLYDRRWKIGECGDKVEKNYYKK